MKQLLTKKWVLSGFLIAALGSQYYFSVSSQHLSSIEMSSLTEATAENLVDVTAIVETQLASASATTTVVRPTAGSSDTVVVNPAPAAAASGDATRRTEGVTTAAGCPGGDCVVFTRAEAERIRAVLASMVASRTGNAESRTSAPATIDCSAERGAEKIRCEREQRELARRDAAEAKREKEISDRELRNEEFLTKMEEAVDRCRGDVACVSRRYTSLLRTYSGRRKIDANVARDAYRTHIESHLRTRLLAGDDSAGLQDIISELSSGIPSDYRIVKDNLTLAIRQTTEIRAAAVKETYRQSQVALSQQNPAESSRLMQEAQAQHYSLTTEVFGNQATGQLGYADILSNNLQSSDPTSWAYVQSNLITPVRNLFSNMIPTSTTGQQTVDANGQPIQNGAGRGVVRGSAAGPALPQLNTGAQTLPQIQNQGITFQPQIAAPQGRRTPR